MDRKHRAELFIAFGVPALGVLIYVVSLLARWPADARALAAAAIRAGGAEGKRGPESQIRTRAT